MSIYRINKAGLYCIGHFNVFTIKLMLGNPSTCGSVTLDEKKTKDLIECLGIDWEDGDYLSDLLEGQMVSVELDDERRFTSIGDPYGRKKVAL